MTSAAMMPAVAHCVEEAPRTRLRMLAGCAALDSATRLTLARLEGMVEGFLSALVTGWRYCWMVAMLLLLLALFLVNAMNSGASYGGAMPRW